jgi:hypothetical protein
MSLKSYFKYLIKLNELLYFELLNFLDKNFQLLVLSFFIICVIKVPDFRYHSDFKFASKIALSVQIVSSPIFIIIIFFTLAKVEN